MRAQLKQIQYKHTLHQSHRRHCPLHAGAGEEPRSLLCGDHCGWQSLVIFKWFRTQTSDVSGSRQHRGDRRTPTRRYRRPTTDISITIDWCYQRWINGEIIFARQKFNVKREIHIFPRDFWSWSTDCLHHIACNNHPSQNPCALDGLIGPMEHIPLTTDADADLRASVLATMLC